ncbi:MAG: Methyltransferase type 11 [Bacteroidetes bacterium]|jgi:tRNA1Val (adenine37-N6)-methyltransferase|nr:Methyltransferase type 11 [Bacteroidota bacterium]
MSNAFFAFKQFTIKQDKCAMKVGTDAVLLGAWIIPNGSKSILDIGTGTGIIAMMLAQKSKANIVAIDIDKDSTDQAALNVQESQFRNIEVKNLSLQVMASTTAQKFSLIVTNPPYFIDSLKSSKDNRTIARHADLLPFEDLISGVKKLLDEKGKFCLILPTKEAAIFREMAKQKGLYLSKLMRVRTRSDKDSEKRHLMQFEFKETEFSESTLIIESDRNMKYSDEYIELTKDYYINF